MIYTFNASGDENKDKKRRGINMKKVFVLFFVSLFVFAITSSSVFACYVIVAGVNGKDFSYSCGQDISHSEGQDFSYGLGR